MRRLSNGEFQGCEPPGPEHKSGRYRISQVVYRRRKTRDREGGPSLVRRLYESSCVVVNIGGMLLPDLPLAGACGLSHTAGAARKMDPDVRSAGEDA